MALASPVPATDRNAPAARREEVRQRVLSEGFVRVEDLVRLFEVSLMTIHRDLDVLEADGWLTKIRGGATANPSALLDAGVPERLAALHVEKEAIAAVAARQLSQGQTIFLDDSTTALSLVPYLREHAPITVATNFLPAVVALGGAPAVDVHLLGGEYHPRQDACFGLQTVEAISRLQADLFFMSTTALTHGRCLHRSEATIGVRRYSWSTTRSSGARRPTSCAVWRSSTLSSPTRGSTRKICRSCGTATSKSRSHRSDGDSTDQRTSHDQINGAAVFT
jgi:DeoR/GlpR family transcriptional regulator of sugar metabolism